MDFSKKCRVVARASTWGLVFGGWGKALHPSDFGPLGADVLSNGHWSPFLRALEYLLMPIRNFSDGHRNSVRWASEFCRVGNNHGIHGNHGICWGGLRRPKPCGRTRKAAKVLRNTKARAGRSTTEVREGGGGSRKERKSRKKVRMECRSRGLHPRSFVCGFCLPLCRRKRGSLSGRTRA